MEKRKKLKFGFLQYWKPTPLLFRKIGDTFLGVSTLLASLEFEHPKKSVIVLVCGIVGKVFTNLFSADD